MIFRMTRMSCCVPIESGASRHGREACSRMGFPPCRVVSRNQFGLWPSDFSLKPDGRRNEERHRAMRGRATSVRMGRTVDV